MRTRDKYRVTLVNISDIKPEQVPLEKSMKMSLFNDDGSKDEQYEEIRLVEIDDPQFKYRYINGRRRTETLRKNGEKQVRAIILSDLDEEQIHWGALHGNSGTRNYADDAEHIAYLKYTCGYRQAKISQKLGPGFSPATVNNLLKIYDKLIKPLFEMLRIGKIKYNTAFLCTKLTEELQHELYEEAKKKDKLTHQMANKKHKGMQSNTANIFDSDDHEDIEGISGYFLTSSDLRRLREGESLIIEVDNQNFKVEVTILQ